VRAVREEVINSVTTITIITIIIHYDHYHIIITIINTIIQGGGYYGGGSGVNPVWGDGAGFSIFKYLNINFHNFLHFF
jgi:hypothetical protein